MTSPSFEDLMATFNQIGIRDPQSWAKSQLEEGIPQLARAVFLKKLWKLLELDVNNMLEYIRDNSIEEPGQGKYYSIASDDFEMRQRELIVRHIQKSTATTICVLLDDPDCVEIGVSSYWCIYQTAEDGTPIAAMTGLSESVRETEPIEFKSALP